MNNNYSFKVGDKPYKHQFLIFFYWMSWCLSRGQVVTKMCLSKHEIYLSSSLCSSLFVLTDRIQLKFYGGQLGHHKMWAEYRYDNLSWSRGCSYPFYSMSFCLRHLWLQVVANNIVNFRVCKMARPLFFSIFSSWMTKSFHEV